MIRRLLTGALLLSFFSIFTTSALKAQVTDTTHPVSIDPELLALANAKTPKEYTIAGIKIVGTKFLDESLLVSISGLTIGDKVVIPGGDNFSKAITKLWGQNLFSDIGIYFTKISGNDIYIQIEVVERPRLGAFTFKNVSKSESDELKTKTGLIVGRVVNDHMKQLAIEKIQIYFADKGYQGATTVIDENKDAQKPNSVDLVFNIKKGDKVRISQINIFGNQAISENRLKKELKGTGEMTRLTLFPPSDTTAYGVNTPISFKEYINNWGFLSFTKSKELLDPYFRFKLFSSAKFNAKKYASDKESLIEYYNSLGYRDANIVEDTTYYNKKGQLDIDIKVDEGHKYYFGNISWKGNTKYSDSLLNLLMGIHKGDIFNQDILK